MRSTEPAAEAADLAARKAALRRSAGARRALLAAAAPDAPERLVALFRAAWSPAPGTAVSGFWPIRSEIDVRPLMRALHGAGCRVALPGPAAGRGAPLSFRAWAPGDPLEAGAFGVPVPAAAAAPVDPDWLLVPLLAWDEEGWRLGYGGGFYDATLAAARRRKPVFAIGVAYEGQKADRTPRGPGDRRLDAILTERRAFRVEGRS